MLDATRAPKCRYGAFGEWGVVEADPVFCASMLLPLCLNSGNPLHVVGKFLRGDGLHVPSLRLRDEARRPYHPWHKECRFWGAADIRR